jgi:RNA chaperone Hfq
MRINNDKHYDEFSENIFLDTLYGKSVNVFILGGVKLDGEFCGHDNVSICLKRDNSELMVYKMAISSITKVKVGGKNTLKYN